MSSLPILVAVPNEWSSPLYEYLEQQGIPVIATHSRDETLAMLKKPQDFRGLIIVSDWAMSTQSNVNT